VRRRALRGANVAPRMTATASPPPVARFDGWRVVALGGALIWLGPGLLECYGFLAAPFGREFGLTGEQFGYGIGAVILPMVLAGPLLGALLDRAPLRRVLLGAIALAVAALLALSRAQSITELALCAGAAALGIGTYGQLGPNVMVAHWFVRLRSRALALTSLGTSCAGITIPLISQPLIAGFGWRGAMVAFAAAIALLLAPAVAWLAVKRPEDIGQFQDGDAPTGAAWSGPAPPEPPAQIEPVLRDRNFWLLGAALAIATAAQLGGVHMVKHMSNAGVAERDARFVLALASVGALCGRFATGWLLERLPQPFVAAGVMALSGIAWVGFAHARDLTTFLLLAIPSGLAGGGFGVSGPVLQASCFGPRVLGRVMGLHGLIGLPLLLPAAGLVGRAADQAGSYTPVFVLLGVATGVAALAVALVRTPGAAGAAPAASP
jgi:predicted MFS family arabinose efflux permease